MLKIYIRLHVLPGTGGGGVLGRVPRRGKNRYVLRIAKTIKLFMNHNKSYHLPPIYGKLLQPHENEAANSGKRQLRH